MEESVNPPDCAPGSGSGVELAVVVDIIGFKEGY
jgi:hypothetical protein